MMRRKMWLWLGLFFYSLFIVLVCFSPQPSEGVIGVSTPGVQRFGPILVLLTPLNSLVHLSQVTSFYQLVWVLLQNLMNIFLLFPLLFLLLCLFPGLRDWKKVVLVSFSLSLGIELTQLLLDLLINANRVFEIDDLWTNTLGGYLAFRIVQWIEGKREL